jgi:hypothetical protein
VKLDTPKRFLFSSVLSFNKPRSREPSLNAGAHRGSVDKNPEDEPPQTPFSTASRFGKGGSEAIATRNELRETMESVNFLSARYVVPVRAFGTMRRSGFPLPNRCSRGLGGRDALIATILMIGNFYEGVGVVVRSGLVD